jgi:2-oxo-4-hydroxy-4-carboxy-5-ureidoimidazoline decarboxylase
MKRSLAALNVLTVEAFTAYLGGVYEHSPWIAEAAAAGRPFDSPAGLHGAMVEVVRAAPQEAQLALIRAHPDLAGKLARLGQLTPESTREQNAAGLDAMTAEEIARMTTANDAYREKFGFPFIICARRHTKDSILASMAERLPHDPATERRAALTEIHHIAELRLHDLLCPEN